MYEIKLTLQIKAEEIGQDQFDYTIEQLFNLIADLWGDKANLLFSEPKKVAPREELVRLSPEVTEEMRRLLKELGVDPSTVFLD